jgi:hypothetical protein
MKLGIRRIKKALSECAFDPDSPGTMRIVADSKNPTFYEEWAIVLIKEAGLTSGPAYNDCIIRAIQLLILAKETKSK